MKRLAAALLGLFLTGAAPDPLTRPINPGYAKQWLGPQAPMRLHGDSWFVGFKGLSIVAIKTPAGVILIDGAVPQAVGQVEANLRTAGMDVRQVRYILNTESHWDHASGIAALARDSGAIALSSPRGAAALKAGRWDADDPQASSLETYPAVARVRGLKDGERLSLGGVVVTAHHTPGHTPGSTSYSWRSCEAGRCADIVFSASLSPIASGDFHYSRGAHGDLTPGFRAAMRKVGALPCDILITSHPAQSSSAKRLAAAEAARSTTPLIDKGACRAYAADFETQLDARIAKEKAGG